MVTLEKPFVGFVPNLRDPEIASFAQSAVSTVSNTNMSATHSEIVMIGLLYAPFSGPSKSAHGKAPSPRANPAVQIVNSYWSLRNARSFSSKDIINTIAE